MSARPIGEIIAPIVADILRKAGFRDDNMENLATACRARNRSKRTKLLSERNA